jgi:hypothetical protein
MQERRQARKPQQPLPVGRGVSGVGDGRSPPQDLMKYGVFGSGAGHLNIPWGVAVDVADFEAETLA